MIVGRQLRRRQLRHVAAAPTSRGSCSRWPNREERGDGPASSSPACCRSCARGRGRAPRPAVRRGADAAMRAAIEAQIEAESHGAGRQPAGCRRRDHRPARHPDGAGHRAVRRATPAPVEGTTRYGRLPDVTVPVTHDPQPARRQPRRDRPARSSRTAGALGIAHRRGRSPTPTPTRRSCARPTRPSPLGGSTAAETYLDVGRVLDAAPADRRRRDPPRLRLPVRERRVRPRPASRPA